jgi:hypothetical protein
MISFRVEEEGRAPSWVRLRFSQHQAEQYSMFFHLSVVGLGINFFSFLFFLLFKASSDFNMPPEFITLDLNVPNVLEILNHCAFISDSISISWQSSFPRPELLGKRRH